MQQAEILEQISAARERLNLSQVEVRQLAHQVIEGVAWPVRSLCDLNCSKLQKLLDVMNELERNQVAARMRGEELVSR